MKVLLFGATGHLGFCIAQAVASKGHHLSVVIRNPLQVERFKSIAQQTCVVDLTQPNALSEVCCHHDVIISALGKSVSLNDRSTTTFNGVDFQLNSAILEAALKNNIQRFIYVSAFHAEKHTDLEYFRVHHDFAEKLMASGLNYLIVKPPALFSAFLDLIALAKQNKAFNIGRGDKKTNPIYEGDLANIIVDHLNSATQVIEAGGQHLYTRKQLIEIVQKQFNPNGRVKSMPVVIFKLLLPLIKIMNASLYHKFAFFLRVMEEDTIAPSLGHLSFEAYMQAQALKL